MLKVEKYDTCWVNNLTRTSEQLQKQLPGWTSLEASVSLAQFLRVVGLYQQQRHDIPMSKC
jgi:hypothetical protein